MCEKLNNLHLPDSKITKIQTVTNGIYEINSFKITGLPNFTLVIIESKPGDKSLIYSEIWLPEKWNGIFVGMGNGGFGGAIGHVAFEYYIKKGYAAACTDMGTSKVAEWGVNNPDMWIDYSWRSTHIMTVVSKMIIEAFYGRKPDYSYFVGSSAGGKQALCECQRFPEDYDGILAKVPSNNGLNLGVYFLWNYIHLSDENNKKLIPEKLAYKITDCATEFFQKNGDGEKGDNFISYPYINETTVTDFLQYLKERCPEITEKQLKSLEAVYNGPVNPKTKEQIYCGVPIGSEIYFALMKNDEKEAAIRPYSFQYVLGEDFNLRDFDFADDMDKMYDAVGKISNHNIADLTNFYKRGGKLIIYSGSSDPSGPCADAIKYYNRVCEKMGGYENVKTFCKYFILPGKEHSDGGRGTNTVWADESKTDVIEAIREWREKGKELQYIIGAHIEKEDDKETITMMRKVYPYKADKKEGIDFLKSTAERYL